MDGLSRPLAAVVGSRQLIRLQRYTTTAVGRQRAQLPRSRRNLTLLDQRAHVFVGPDNRCAASSSSRLDVPNPRATFWRSVSVRMVR